MSTREERALEVIVTRLSAISGMSVVVDPEDEHGDLLEDSATGERVDVLTSPTLPDGEPNRHQYHVTKRITLRGLSRVPSELEEDATPTDIAMLGTRVGYSLFSRILTAVFPTGAAEGYQDNLGGAASDFTYAGHEIFTREDGGKTVAVYIDCDIAYVLALDKPNK